MSDLIGAKYILADKKLGEVLQTIASSALIYGIFGHVTENFDYETYKSVCFVDTGDGTGDFTLPARDEDILAFVFLLLVEADGKKTDVLTLCDKYFRGETKQASYSNFALKVLIPFEKLTVATAEKILEEEKKLHSDISEETAAEVENKEILHEPEEVDEVKKHSRAEEFIKIQRAFVAENKKLSDFVKEEINCVFSSLLSSLESGDEEGVATAFIALKYIDKCNKKARLDIDAVSELIKREL